MPKFFVCSDIHSHFRLFIRALGRAGYDPENTNHWLVVCGDVFDRGPHSYDLLKYLMKLKRKILIRGNHEDLLEECCVREYAYSHDKSNGTVKTIKDIGGANRGNSFDECCQITWNKTAGYRDLLVNYFETQNYIFVHGWIPCEVNHVGPSWYSQTRYAYMPDWRECNEVEWEAARWTNGIKSAIEGIVEPGKTIVCGHWHCSLGHAYDSNGTISEFGDDAIWDPWYHEGCIAIDRCTAHTGECNVLVIEDEFLKE